MARNAKPVVITAEGRDKGKTFWLTELDALTGERWARRALFVLGKSGRVAMPDGFEGGGWAALLQIGTQALFAADFAEAEPLFDEMLECVAFVPDAGKVDAISRNPITRPVDWPNDVEEIATILQLRSEVFEVHTGFSIAAFLSNLGAAAKAALSSNDTSMSPKASETSLAPASPVTPT